MKKLTLGKAIQLTKKEMRSTIGGVSEGAGEDCALQSSYNNCFNCQISKLGNLRNLPSSLEAADSYCTTMYRFRGDGPVTVKS